VRIDVAGLRRTFTVTDREPGVRAALRSIVRRSRREIVAVDGITFSVEPGEIVGFLGPNGAGKTTTLKVVSGLLTPTAGSVSVGGFLPSRRETAFLMQLGFIMGQRHQLHFDLPVEDGFEVRRVIYGISRPDYERVKDELVELLGLQSFLSQPVRKLSLGQRMRAEIAATLLHEPSVVLLDEPTLGLDFEAQRQIRRFVAEYVSRHRASVILTSHYLADVTALCRRVIAIAGGVIRYDGDLDALAARAGNRKRVELRLRAPVAESDLESLGRVVEARPSRVTVEVEQVHTGEVVNRALQMPGVADVNLADPPLEDALADVYRLDPP
jgi:ABC-2 type transport system ATP-binding protein